LAISSKDVREIVGFTFSKVDSDAQGFFKLACSFKMAAELLDANAKAESSLASAYYFNAGLSIELIMKAVAVAKGKHFDKNHRLNELYVKSGITLTSNQICTLDLFSEIIVWRGRYPTPKKERQWDDYHVILEKHIVRKQEGNTFKTIAHKDRFPTLENYLKIWKLCEEEYRNTLINPA